MLNPPTQYASDANFRKRQRLWEHQDPPFDLVGWVLGLAAVGDGDRVLDVGCGNGVYMRSLARRDVAAVGCDLSFGMLTAAGHVLAVNGDARRLPARTAAFDVVLAPHMLYHVPDRAAAAHELRRVLRPGGRCVVVTNGAGHMRELRELVEAAARTATPDWEMRNPSTHAFSLDNGAEQLRVAFASVELMRPVGVAPVIVHDPDVVADYVASVADHYEHEVARPWADVVADVRQAVADRIAREGAFITQGDVGAFVCS